MAAQILSGNVFDLLPTIKPGSVDCVVTSPPYWQLRSYLPKGHPFKHLELGSEPTVDCGRPMLELRDDLTEKEREFVTAQLRALGFL